MTPLTNLNSRNLLIAIYDAVATTVAVFASLYLRFEGDLLADRLPVLLLILPVFIVLSVIVCYVFNLTTTKWRFISFPGLAEYSRRGDDAYYSSLGAGLCFCRPERPWRFLLRQDYDYPFLVS